MQGTVKISRGWGADAQGYYGDPTYDASYKHPMPIGPFDTYQECAEVCEEMNLEIKQ